MQSKLDDSLREVIKGVEIGREDLREILAEIREGLDSGDIVFTSTLKTSQDEILKSLADMTHMQTVLEKGLPVSPSVMHWASGKETQYCAGCHRQIVEITKYCPDCGQRYGYPIPSDLIGFD